MQNHLEKSFLVPISMCDTSAKMGFHHILSVFQDMAGEHGNILGVGLDDLAERGLQWLTVRSKLIIKSRPRISDEVTVKTWPEAPSKIRCNRYYTLSLSGETVAEGKTEWAIIQKESAKLQPPAEVFPSELIYLDEKVCDKPFLRIAEAFSPEEKLASYTVSSSDIDVGHHMNNIAYIRAALGALSSEALTSNDISEIDVVFRAQCYEGEELSVFARTTDTGLEIGLIKPDGKAAALISLISGKPFIL